MPISWIALPKINLYPKSAKIHLFAFFWLVTCALSFWRAEKIKGHYLTPLTSFCLFFLGKTRNKTNVRFNELGHVCCVVPGRLLLCTESCRWCLLLSIWLSMIINTHRGKKENHFHMTWRWKKFYLSIPFQNTVHFPNSLFISMSSTAFHVIIKFPLLQLCLQINFYSPVYHWWEVSLR